MASFLQSVKQLLRDEFPIFAILPAIIGITTILVCYVMAVDVYGHIPAWFSLPEVSLLGAKQPEHTIYQIGVAITFIACIFFFFSFAYFLDNIPSAHNYRCSKWLMQLSLIPLGIGLLFQGIICLSTRRLRHLQDGAVLDTQSTVHRAFAGLLFVSALLHQLTAVQFYFRCLPHLLYSKWFKLWLLVITSVCITGFVLFHQLDADERDLTLELMTMHYAGIFEWVAVFCMLVFFASYAADYYSFQRMQTEQEIESGYYAQHVHDQNVVHTHRDDHRPQQRVPEQRHSDRGQRNMQLANQRQHRLQQSDR